MNAPSQLKPALWGAVGGAVALAIVGFTWGGWVTGGTARTLANVVGEDAVVKRDDDGRTRLHQPWLKKI